MADAWACSPGRCLGNGTCVDGFVGPFCALCASGYYHANGVCASCSAENAIVVGMILVLGLITLIGIAALGSHRTVTVFAGFAIMLQVVRAIIQTASLDADTSVHVMAKTLLVVIGDTSAMPIECWDPKAYSAASTFFWNVVTTACLAVAAVGGACAHFHLTRRDTVSGCCGVLLFWRHSGVTGPVSRPGIPPVIRRNHYNVVQYDVAQAPPSSNLVSLARDREVLMATFDAGAGAPPHSPASSLCSPAAAGVGSGAIGDAAGEQPVPAAAPVAAAAPVSTDAPVSAAAAELGAHPDEVDDEALVAELRRRMHERVVRAIMLVMVVSYQRVVSSAIEMLYCVPVNPSGVLPYTYVLAVDRSVTCFQGGTLAGFVIAVVVLALYGIAAPVTTFWWLKRLHSRGRIYLVPDLHKWGPLHELYDGKWFFMTCFWAALVLLQALSRVYGGQTTASAGSAAVVTVACVSAAGVLLMMHVMKQLRCNRFDQQLRITHFGIALLLLLVAILNGICATNDQDGVAAHGTRAVVRLSIAIICVAALTLLAALTELVRKAFLVQGRAPVALFEPVFLHKRREAEERGEPWPLELGSLASFVEEVRVRAYTAGVERTFRVGHGSVLVPFKSVAQALRVIRVQMHRSQAIGNCNCCLYFTTGDRGAYAARGMLAAMPFGGAFLLTADAAYEYERAVRLYGFGGGESLANDENPVPPQCVPVYTGGSVAEFNMVALIRTEEVVTDRMLVVSGNGPLNGNAVSNVSTPPPIAPLPTPFLRHVPLLPMANFPLSPRVLDASLRPRPSPGAVRSPSRPPSPSRLLVFPPTPQTPAAASRGAPMRSDLGAASPLPPDDLSQPLRPARTVVVRPARTPGGERQDAWGSPAPSEKKLGRPAPPQPAPPQVPRPGQAVRSDANAPKSPSSGTPPTRESPEMQNGSIGVEAPPNSEAAPVKQPGIGLGVQVPPSTSNSMSRQQSEPQPVTRPRKVLSRFGSGGSLPAIPEAPEADGPEENDDAAIIRAATRAQAARVASAAAAAAAAGAVTDAAAGGAEQTGRKTEPPPRVQNSKPTNEERISSVPPQPMPPHPSASGHGSGQRPAAPAAAHAAGAAGAAARDPAAPLAARPPRHAARKLKDQTTLRGGRARGRYTHEELSAREPSRPARPHSARERSSTESTIPRSKSASEVATRRPRAHSGGFARSFSSDVVVDGDVPSLVAALGEASGDASSDGTLPGTLASPEKPTRGRTYSGPR